MLKTASPTKKSALDSMLETMEEYTQQLESKVSILEIWKSTLNKWRVRSDPTKNFYIIHYFHVSEVSRTSPSSYHMCGARLQGYIRVSLCFRLKKGGRSWSP